MIGHRIAVGGVAAGLLLGGWAVVGPSSEVDPLPGPASVGAAPWSVSALSPTATDPATIAPDANGRTLDEMEDFWQERVDAAPADYLSRHSLATVLLAQAREDGDLDRYVDAERVLEEALEINPTHVPSRMALTSALAAQHRFSEALGIAEGVLADEPGHLPARAAVGDARFELGDYDAADRSFRALFEAEPSAPVLSRLARLASVQGDPAAAVDHARRALELSRDLDLRPSDAAFYRFQLGVFQYGSGDVAAAIESLRQARAVDPHSAAATEKLAMVLANEGSFAEAIELYRELTADGGAADLHWALADLLVRTGDPAGAELEFAIAVGGIDETLDRYPAERRHVIGILFDLDPERALDLARIEIEQRQDVHGWDQLAWALHLTGDDRAAADAIEQALAPGIEDASFRYHAGVIAAANGDLAAARAHLDVALGINPRFALDDADDARALLESLG